MKRLSDLPFHYQLFSKWTTMFFKTITDSGGEAIEDDADNFRFEHGNDMYEVKIRKLPKKK